MRKIIIIGTLHAGLTPNRELEKIFIKYKPTQILVEIAASDLENQQINQYPPEMIFTYQWAIKNNVKVNGFDSKINTLRKGVTEKDDQKLLTEQKKIISKYSWQEFNQIEKEKLIDIGNITDPEKESERENEMLNNINQAIIKEGVILIITGCGHLNFFEQNMPNAILPFR